MSPLSNAEKQARHRKKEDLKRFAERCFRQAQIGAPFKHGVDAPAMLAQLKALAELPSGWTDEDLTIAGERIQQLYVDLINPGYELENDVDAARGWSEEFKRTSVPHKAMKENLRAIEDTRALASHLISALELTHLSNGERAAALMEAMRHVARSLANERPLRRSAANTVCLLSLPPQYRRPDWFSESFAEWIAHRIGEEEATKDLGQKIINNVSKARM